MTSSDHVQSYYAATANDASRYPALDGDISVDVCIIGGGFSGVASALTLAERGRSVALVEANRIGWGASGRNGGQVLPAWSGEGEMVRQLGQEASEFLWRTRYRGNDIVEERIRKYGIECDYVRGAITVALKPFQLNALKAEYDEAVEHGHKEDVEFVGKDGLSAYVGSDMYLGGFIEKRGAHCHPLNLCLGEARAAASLGAKLFESTRVTEIIHGDRPVVVTDKGRITANHVILAGNAYTKLEREKLGGYLLPAQTYVITTNQLDEATAKEILPQNSGVCDANWVLDYFRLTGDRRLLFGGRCTYSGREIVDVEGALLPRMKRIFPQLEDARVEHQWGGTIGIILNRVPMIGRLSPKVFYVQGYSGHGVNCSHIVAEIFSDAIDANAHDATLFERVSHFRIPAADVIGSPMLALGMTYYRMKDAIGF
ncbi:MAG: FAD-binding oxidoreductase [Parvularculaceae bacterium]